MANAITLARKDLQETLDLVYKRESFTDILSPAPSMINFNGANSVRIAKRSLSGYGDYARQNGGAGFPTGDTSLTWETHTLGEDRGIELTVDRMDNDDSGMNAFTSLASFAGQFQRENAVPEVDAYRFAMMAQAAITATNAVQADLSASTAKTALDTAIESMTDAEVEVARCICYMSAEMFNYMKNNSLFTYNVNAEAENAIDTRFASYDGMRVIVVPAGRFFSDITLNDGATTYGYANAGTKINFLIVDPQAVLPVVKLEKIKYFTPDENQRGDSHLLQPRLYHDIFVLENKVDGLYVHYKTA